MALNSRVVVDGLFRVSDLCCAEERTDGQTGILYRFAVKLLAHQLTMLS